MTMRGGDLIAALTVFGGMATLDGCTVNVQASLLLRRAKLYPLLRMRDPRVVLFVCSSDARPQQNRESALATTNGGTLSLARLAVPAATWATAVGGLSGNGSRLALHAVTVPERPEWGVLNGTVTAGAEGEPLAYDPPGFIHFSTQNTAHFEVRFGPCLAAVVGGRQCVGRWPGGYLPEEHCEIAVVGGAGTLGD
eukprot:SAG11_NODE_9181_length_935_cov_0.751196_1_plen_194_part_10